MTAGFFVPGEEGERPDRRLLGTLDQEQKPAPDPRLLGTL
jgi:hypothetical protein